VEKQIKIPVGLPIGFFDSGIGGLTVLDAAKRILPQERFIYISDTGYAPYGDKSPAYIVRRADICVRRLIACGCKAVVVACNTATSAAIRYLRDKHQIPIIGTEPAVLPAVRECGRESILVLTTVGAAAQKKFRAQVNKLNADGYNIIVAPQEDLAMLIERDIGNPTVLRSFCRDILDKYPDVCGIVLGCTHFVYLRPYFGSKVKLFDGNVGVAFQLKRVVEENYNV